MIFERMYGTATTVSVPLIAFSTTSFHTSVTSTMFSAGDTKISKDYGGFTNTATTPTGDASNFMMILSLTATEMAAAHIEIRIVDSVTKVWEDQMVVFETYGTTSAQHAFNRGAATVQASLTASQAGVTIATVTQVTNQVVASLTANQAGVTIATVTNVTNGVNLTTTAILNNLAASATAQINAEVDTALADASVTAAAMNKIHDATAAATATWGMTQSAFTVAGTFGEHLDATVSGISVSGTGDWTDAERAYIRHALGVPGSTTAGSGGIINSISSKVTSLPTDTANAIFGTTLTSSSFNTDTFGERVTAIDNKLPSGSISGFDPAVTTVIASLTAAQNGVTIANVTTVATVTNVTNGVNLTATTVLNNLGASATAQINAEADTALADASVTAAAMNKIHDATSGASAVFGFTLTSTSFNADTAGQRVTAIDNLLPSATISSFDPAATTVSASLTANQAGVTIATVTQVTNQVIASLTAAQTGVTIANVTTVATVTNVTNGVNLTATTVLNNLGASATAQINAEMVDVVNVDTMSELGQATPSATPTMRQALMGPYMALRNQVTVSSTQKKFFNDAGTNIFTKAVSDDGSTYTETEASTGS